MIIKRVVVVMGLALLVSIMLTGCALYAWVFGHPTSFAFADGTSEPASMAAVVTRAESESLPDYKEYGVFANRTWEASDILPIMEANATRIATYTPDVFTIPMAKVGFLSADSREGFWVLQGSEGIFGEMEYFDFTEPVYVMENLLWDWTTYDMLFVTMGVGGGDIGGEPYTPDIQIHAPGYTDADMPSTYSLLWDGYTGSPTFTIKHHQREYLGDNRFSLVGGELFHESVYLPNGEEAYDSPVDFFYGAGFLMFRNDIAKTRIYRAEWYIDGSTEGLPARPPAEVFYSGNTWITDQVWRPAQPNGWIDIPFEGLSIAEGTKELRVTIRWDLENIIELWDFGENGLHFLFAPDFLDRFSVEVEQL